MVTFVLIMEPIASLGHDVVFSTQGYTALEALLQQKDYSKSFILVDSTTHQHCIPHFLSQLQQSYDFEIIEIDPGEERKNLTTCTGVWEALSELGADRHSLIINLGGGVVTDLGGFVAACYKRGIDFINIPTTLLAMVDAAVGGKTGVDLGVLKNQVGIILPPALVLVDPSYLHTLPKEEFRSGYAEMLKHGLITDAAYFRQLAAYPPQEEVLPQLIHKSVAIKNKVVLEDPREAGLRKILNFGHTLGHAIESYFMGSGKNRLLHGEAIAIGMVLEAYLSTQCCQLDTAAADEIKAVFGAIYPKVAFTAADITAILALLQHDKKNTHGKVQFVLLEALGIPKIDVQVPQELFAPAFEYYLD